MMRELMHYSKSGIELTQKFEVFRYRAYKDGCKSQLHDLHHVCDCNCPGIWTIGFGHTRNVKEGDVITFEYGVQLLKQDYAVAESCVNTFVAAKLNQHQFDALVDFCFNIGCHAFTTSTCVKLLNDGKIEDADEEFYKWHFSAGKDCPGLMNRRKAEHEEYNAI